MAIQHGGRLRAAAREYGIPLAQWLDLSTGISPWSWPVPSVPESVWRRLPEADDTLEETARQWAGVPDAAACIPVPGSQAAIQLLPRLRTRSRVGVPRVAYAEHAHCWAMAGHEVIPLDTKEIESRLDTLDVLVWLHPNNPTGEVLPTKRLLSWHEHLATRSGWLVVDEAFVEASEAESLVHAAGREGLFILRSIGKFFGLAGLRGGLLIGPQAHSGEFLSRLGPWALSGPARWLMRRALADTDWQQMQNARLRQASAELRFLLTDVGFHVAGGTGLFQYIHCDQADAVKTTLATKGILLRCFEQPRALRFGLPGEKDHLLRLQSALSGL